MNLDTQSILELVRAATTELNEELEYEHLQQIDADTPIFEGDLALDSLSLVTLIVDIEGRVSDAYDCEVMLASDKAMSMLNSPYRTVGSLVEFILTEVTAATQASAANG